MTTAPSSGANDETVHVWAVATNGDALYRLGVTSRRPEGLEWVAIKSDSPFQAITVAQADDSEEIKVWAIGKDGSCYFRHGVTSIAPTGQSWLQIDPPYGTKLKSVSGGSFLWALDTSDRLYFRKEDPILPSWVYLPIVSTAGEFAPSSATVKGISSAGNEVWGVLDNVTPTPSGGGVWNYVASAAGAGPVGGAVASVASQASGGECN